MLPYRPLATYCCNKKIHYPHCPSKRWRCICQYLVNWYLYALIFGDLFAETWGPRICLWWENVCWKCSCLRAIFYPDQIKSQIALTFSFLVVQLAHVVVVVKCNIERCDVGTGVDPVSLSQANPNPMREGKPQDLSAVENWKLHKVCVNLAPIWRYYFTSFGHCMCATLLQDSLKNFLLELIIAMLQYHPLWIAFTDIMMFWFV